MTVTNAPLSWGSSTHHAPHVNLAQSDPVNNPSTPNHIPVFTDAKAFMSCSAVPEVPKLRMLCAKLMPIKRNMVNHIGTCNIKFRMVSMMLG